MPNYSTLFPPPANARAVLLPTDGSDVTVEAGGILIVNDNLQIYNVGATRTVDNSDLTIFTPANNWRAVGDGSGSPINSAHGNYILPFGVTSPTRIELEYTLNRDVDQLDVLDVAGNVLVAILDADDRTAGFHRSVAINLTTDARNRLGTVANGLTNEPLLLRANQENDESEFITPNVARAAIAAPATGTVTIVPGGIVWISATEQYINVSTGTQSVTDGTPSVAFTSTAIWRPVGDGSTNLPSLPATPSNTTKYELCLTNAGVAT